MWLEIPKTKTGFLTTKLKCQKKSLYRNYPKFSDRSRQTMQAQIRLPSEQQSDKSQSDQGLL